MKLKKFYYLAFVFYFVCAFLYSYNNYEESKAKLFSQLDSDLKQGALSVPLVLPINFINSKMQKADVAETQDKQNIQRLSQLAKVINLQYVYAMIMQDEKVLFIASSATDEELKREENLSHYFDNYDDASKALKQTFKTNQITFDNVVDKWGSFRSIFIPQTTKDGLTYVLGADIRTDSIQSELRKVLIKSLLEVLFFTVILIPLFLSYFFHNKSVNRELERRVSERTKQVKTLLNNANQGFLSFSIDMIIHNEYSEKCVEIFGKEIAGENVSKLLFAEETERSGFAQNLASLIGDEDSLKVETILSLLKNEFIIKDKIISAEYKMVDSDAFMIILTDITEKIALEKRLDKERRTLKMVVSAVANPNEFFELIEDYKEFMQNRVSLVDNDKTPTHNISELYRMVHTYKGNFAQKDFITTPQGLHKLETKLSKFLSDANTTNKDLVLILQKVELEAWLTKDLDLLKQILGEGFFEDEEKIIINTDVINNLKEAIKGSIISLGVNDETLEDIMFEVESLKLRPLVEALSSYPKLVEQVAQKLEKSVYPMQIVCDKKICIGDEYKPFIRSLVHIFRNSIDHGLESADDRVENGKDEYGTILCAVNEEPSGLISLVIADDGAGINLHSVAKKAIQNGLCTPEEIEVMSEEEIAMLIFSDNFSTKDEVSELSGRGVGLSAVKAELERIGGFMRISTKSGIGATFTFYLHYNKRQSYESHNNM